MPRPSSLTRIQESAPSAATSTVDGAGVRVDRVVDEVGDRAGQVVADVAQGSHQATGRRQDRDEGLASCGDLAPATTCDRVELLLLRRGRARRTALLQRDSRHSGARPARQTSRPRSSSARLNAASGTRATRRAGAGRVGAGIDGCRRGARYGPRRASVVRSTSTCRRPKPKREHGPADVVADAGQQPQRHLVVGDGPVEEVDEVVGDGHEHPRALLDPDADVSAASRLVVREQRAPGVGATSPSSAKIRSASAGRARAEQHLAQPVPARDRQPCATVETMRVDPARQPAAARGTSRVEASGADSAARSSAVEDGRADRLAEQHRHGVADLPVAVRLRARRSGSRRESSGPAPPRGSRASGADRGWMYQ